MTKYDIRVRRKGLTKGQIERHKDFRSIKSAAGQHRETGSLMKLIVLVVSVALLIGMVVFGYNKVKEKKQAKPQTPAIEMKK